MKKRDSRLSQSLERYQRNYLLHELELNHWNRTQTAKALGIPYRTLRDKIHRFKLIPPQEEFSGSPSS